MSNASAGECINFRERPAALPLFDNFHAFTVPFGTEHVNPNGINVISVSQQR